MKKTMIIQTMAAICSLAAMAEIPQGYYSPLDGKSGDGLSAAVTALSAGHVRVTYNTKTWPAFETTDVRTVNGRNFFQRIEVCLRVSRRIISKQNIFINQIASK